jgi:hypothetical protein
LCSTVFVPEEKDLAVGGSLFPAADSIFLDDTGMADERLWRGENRQHVEYSL